jgi:hypothetical protein
VFDFRFNCVEAGQCRVKENSDRGVTRRELNHSRDNGRLELAHRAEDRV